MTDVFSCGQVGLKHQPDPHGVTPLRCDVHRGTNGVLQFQSVGFNWDDFEDRELLDQLFGSLPNQMTLLVFPTRSFEIKAGDKAT